MLGLQGANNPDAKLAFVAELVSQHVDLTQVDGEIGEIGEDNYE